MKYRYSQYGKPALVKEIKDIVRQEHGHVSFKKPIKALVSHYGEYQTILITDLKDDGVIKYKIVLQDGVPYYHIDNIVNLYNKLLEEIILELYSEDYI